MSHQKRIIELQKSLRIARNAMERIAQGHARDPEQLCQETLTELWKLEAKQQLQGLVGHAPRRR